MRIGSVLNYKIKISLVFGTSTFTCVTYAQKVLCTDYFGPESLQEYLLWAILEPYGIALNPYIKLLYSRPHAPIHSDYTG